MHVRTLSDFGLPEPENVQTELEIERLKYDPAYQAQLLEELNKTIPNNEEQQEIFEYVEEQIDTLEPEKTNFLFINGPAGSGKSTLSQKSKVI